MKPLICLCILALAISSSAQAPAPTLKVTAHLVQVNVIVQGRQHEPISGLTKEDFQIYDDGKKQEVATLSVESSLPSGAAEVQALPPGTFTNRVELRPKGPKVATILLLDGLNTALANQAAAKQQTIKFLEQLHPDDRVALYSLGANLRILHDFTDDAAVLIRALKKHRPHVAGEAADAEADAASTGDADFDSWLSESSEAEAGFQTVNRVKTTLYAIQAIANHAARITGRKNLIWISNGFPFSIGLDGFSTSPMLQQQTFESEIERTARAVSMANLAIYPIDSRGLVNLDFDANRRNMGMGTPSGGPSIRVGTTSGGPSRRMQRIALAHDAMRTLAERTGGTAYYNGNDLKRAIRDAIDDSRVTYVIGYYPAHHTWDGKWHGIKVTVNRKGVEVRHRQGYFAFAEVPETVAGRGAALEEALWSPLDESAVGMTVHLSPDTPQQGELEVTIALDVHNVSMELRDGKHEGKVDLLLAQQPARDQPVKVADETLAMHLTQPQYDQALEHGILLARNVSQADAAFKLKVIVRDVVSGNTGSVSIRTGRLLQSTSGHAASGPAR